MDGSRFTHREREPHSFDSICLQCFQTVGTREQESDLKADEQRHECQGLPLGSGKARVVGA